MIKQYTDLDMTTHVIKNAAFESGDTLPTNPVDKQYFFDTTENALRYYDATKKEWSSISSNKLTVKSTDKFKTLIPLEKDTVIVLSKMPYELSLRVPQATDDTSINEYYVIVTPVIDLDVYIDGDGDGDGIGDAGAYISDEDLHLEFLHDYLLKITQKGSSIYFSKIGKRNALLDQYLFFYYKKHMLGTANLSLTVTMSNRTSDCKYGMVGIRTKDVSDSPSGEDYSGYVSINSVSEGTTELSVACPQELRAGWIALKTDGVDNVNFNNTESFTITGNVTKKNEVSFSTPNYDNAGKDDTNIDSIELRGDILSLVGQGASLKGNKITFARMFTGMKFLTGFDKNVFTKLGEKAIYPSALLAGTFMNCPDFNHIPEGFMSEMADVPNGCFCCTFANTALKEVPDDCFKSVTTVGLLGFGRTFANDYELSYVGDNVFSKVVTVGEMSFDGTFLSCIALQRLPASLFNAVTYLDKDAFSQTFDQCKSLPALPKRMFNALAEIGDKNYTEAFYCFAQDCWNLKNAVVPASIFTMVQSSTGTATDICKNMYKNCHLLVLKNTDTDDYGASNVMNVPEALAYGGKWNNYFQDAFDDIVPDMATGAIAKGYYAIDEKVHYTLDTDVTPASSGWAGAVSDGIFIESSLTAATATVVTATADGWYFLTYGNSTVVSNTLIGAIKANIMYAMIKRTHTVGTKEQSSVYFIDSKYIPSDAEHDAITVSTTLPVSKGDTLNIDLTHTAGGTLRFIAKE